LHLWEETRMSTTTRYVVSAPYHSYEGVMPSGRTSASFDTEAEARAFIGRVEVYATVQPAYPYGIGCNLDPDHETAVDAWDSWEDVREFGFEDGCLTGPLTLSVVTETVRVLS
jgi:hypothetical protein